MKHKELLLSGGEISDINNLLAAYDEIWQRINALANNDPQRKELLQTARMYESWIIEMQS